MGCVFTFCGNSGRLLLIVTFRPEFEPPWTGRHYVAALTINRLAQHDIEAMIDRVGGDLPSVELPGDCIGYRSPF